MGGNRTDRGRLDDGVLDYQLAGPTVLRMAVGARLRRLREACGISREDAGEAIRASHSKISRLELGRVGFKQRDVVDLLTLYGVHDDAERASVLDLARQANTPAWWNDYGDVVPSWFEGYLGLEQGASVIRTYQVQFVPGLLQTADYARAVIRLGHHTATEAEIDRRVELRMRRQQILRRAPRPAKLWAALDEAVLHRPVGSPAAMRAQLQHLIAMADHPNVTIQVLPFSVGGHAAAGGPVTLLRFREAALPDVVYLEQLVSAVHPDRPEDVNRYSHVMDQVAVQAEEPRTSTETLHRLLADT